MCAMELCWLSPASEYVYERTVRKRALPLGDRPGTQIAEIGQSNHARPISMFPAPLEEKRVSG